MKKRKKNEGRELKKMEINIMYTRFYTQIQEKLINNKNNFLKFHVFGNKISCW